MGIMDLYAAQSGVNEQPLQALPRSFGERFGAEVDAATAPDRYFNLNASRRDMWQRAIDDVHGATGEAFSNPYGAVTPEEMTRLGNQPAVIAERRNKIIEASRMVRAAGNDQLFDPENIDRYIGEEGNRARGTAAEFEGTGNGLGAFLGGMAAPTPENLVGLVVPPLRISTGAAVVGNTFLRGLAREAGYQAAVNMGLEALAEGADVAARGETGTAPGLGEVAGNVAMAGVAGAVLGGGIHAAHAGAVKLHQMWTGLPEEVRAKAPLEVQDAFRTIESEALYSGQNRLGIDPMVHERYQGQAFDAVMRGRAVALDELAPADTPMTALGTILRQQTGTVEMPRLVGIPDEGLRDAFARTAALPDSEIEPFAREARPRSFARLDRVEGDLQQARAQLDEITSQRPSIADLVDPDTAERLQDIDADLARSGLRRQRRDELEREREMILQTVDPRDRLPRQAEKDQQAKIVDIEQRIAKLEETRAEARKTSDAAVADLKTKLGRYGDMAEPAQPQAVAQDLGFTEPAGLADAIHRADLFRQAAIAREAMPAAESPAQDAVRQASVAERPATSAATESPPDPEQLAALKTQADAVLAEPGRLGDFKRYAVRELDAADLQMKDATAAIRCAMGAPI